jgi:hypothetical protein
MTLMYLISWHNYSGGLVPVVGLYNPSAQSMFFYKKIARLGQALHHLVQLHVMFLFVLEATDTTNTGLLIIQA